jgi:hypothetical protein
MPVSSDFRQLNERVQKIAPFCRCCGVSDFFSSLLIIIMIKNQSLWVPDTVWFLVNENCLFSRKHFGRAAW